MRISIIDKKEVWESFLLKHSPQSLFQSFSWGEVEKALGKKVWRIGISEKYQKLKIKNYQKNLLGIAQIVKVEAKRGSFLHVRHGPVFKKWEGKIIKVWLRWIKGLAKQEKVSFIRISPLLKPQEAGLLQTLGFRSAPIPSLDAETAWVLDLNKNEEELLYNMRKTTRYLIKKGEKDGLKVIKSKDLNDIYHFLKLYKKTYQRHGFLPHQGIKEEYKIFKKGSQADLFLAKYQGEVLAAALIIYYGNQAIYHHGASVRSSIPASYLLQWKAIKEAKRQGLRYYNFWGIAETKRKNHPWWGLTLFKKGFGGEKKEYLHAQDLPISLLYYFTFLLEKSRKWLRGY